MKKILYIDMDGVVADFEKAVNDLDPTVLINDCHETRGKLVDALCEANTDIFHNLEPIENAIKSVEILFDHYEVYFLSTPMWNVPESFTGKRIWILHHFGQFAYKRLILTHRKDLNIGDYLIDDRLKNGAGEFKGEHIHFGQSNTKNWVDTLNYLSKKDGWDFNPSLLS